MNLALFICFLGLFVDHAHGEKDNYRCQKLGDDILEYLDIERRTNNTHFIRSVAPYVERYLGVPVSDRSGIRDWACKLAGVRSKEDLETLIGNSEMANELYNEWIKDAPRNILFGELAEGYLNVVKAMEGLGVLGISGFGVSKYETYSCEDLVAAMMDGVISWRKQFEDDKEVIEAGHSLLGISNLFDEQVIRDWSCKFSGVRNMEDLVAFFDGNEEKAERFHRLYKESNREDYHTHNIYRLRGQITRSLNLY